MERSKDIDIIADEISDKIIKKMNHLMNNYLEVECVKEEIKKLETKIYENFDNALISMNKLRDELCDLTEEEKLKKVEEIEQKRDNKYKKLRKQLDALIEKNRKVEWTGLQKIRFVYLEMGKYLEKNTDFFLNDKLDKLSLSKEERDAVYNNNLLLISDNNKRDKIYQVICKSAAYFLKVAYDKLGIVNSMVHTLEAEQDIRHWFLVAQDEDKKQYFLTLAPDLPFIKNHFPTEHFATDIPLFDAKGYMVYDAFDLDNIAIQLGIFKNKSRITNEEYTGYGIKHEFLIEKQLRDLDRTIGYDDLYKSKTYVNSPEFDKLKERTLKDYSMVNRQFRRCFGFENAGAENFRYINPSSLDDKKLFKNMDELKYSEFTEFKDFLLPYVYNFVKDKYGELLNGNENLDTFYKDVIYSILKKYNNKDFSKHSITHIVTKMKKECSNITDDNDRECFELLKATALFVDNFNVLFDCRNKLDSLKELDSLALDDKQHERIGKIVEQVKTRENDALTQLSMRRISYYLQEIASTISVNKDLKFEGNDYISQERIVNRFLLLFPKIMDFNSDFNKTDSSTDFSRQNYSEQIVIIKRVLNALYADLSHDNCSRCSEYTRARGFDELPVTTYSPAENRINTYPLKDKETGEYCIGFTFSAADDEGIVEFIYVPHCNELRRRNPIEDRKRYWIASVRFNEELRKIEDIDSSTIFEEELIANHCTR